MYMNMEKQYLHAWLQLLEKPNMVEASCFTSNELSTTHPQTELPVHGVRQHGVRIARDYERFLAVRSAIATVMNSSLCQ